MKNIKYVTLEEKIKEVQETEKQIKDKPTTERKLLDLCGHLYSLRKKPYKQVKILSDYDTDGIASAYNMYKFFSGICNVPVKAEINDRRNGYGISDKIIPEKDTLYVVLDMGSNQLDYIDEVLGNDTIIIDHHIIEDEKIINYRYYHTIKELKNGEGPHPIRTSKGWLHLAHGVRGCASGLRYVLYLYVTALEDPAKVIAEPAGYFMSPQGMEYVGDVANVLFSNGWIVDDDGKVYIYYASSDTRLHVATSDVNRLLDYCFNTPADGYRSAISVKNIKELIACNRRYL